MDYLLGIDMGTTGCKAVLYNTAGEIQATGYQEYSIISTADGWAEENPDDWWEAARKTVGICLSRCGAQARNILGVAVSCTNALVPVNRDGQALYGAILQVDQRAQEQAARCRALCPDEKVLEKTGNYVRAGGYSPSTVLWIKENLPRVYADTYKFLAPSGYIVQKLTGAFTMDYSRASTAGLMDMRELRWSEEICMAMGIDISKLPELYPSETEAGTIQPEPARELGLTPGIPVAVGLMDSAASVIGSGCCEPGRVNHVIGTVSRMCVPMREPVFYPLFLNAYLHREAPYFSMAPTNGGGVSLRWFADAFGDQERAIAQSMNMNPYELFDLKASCIPPGSEGLLYLPYILGERSPIWDPNARGVFFGITQKHTKSHFMRSIMEGVGHATLQNLQLMEQVPGMELKEIVLTGGGARSVLWCEIMANMLEKRVVRLTHTECETKGAAFIAGMTAGVYHTLRQSVGLVRVQSEIHSDSSQARLYKPFNALYQSLYTHLREDFQGLNEIMRSL